VQYTGWRHHRDAFNDAASENVSFVSLPFLDQTSGRVPLTLCRLFSFLFLIYQLHPFTLVLCFALR